MFSSNLDPVVVETAEAENARKKGIETHLKDAEARFSKDPLDPDNLISMGHVLLQLAELSTVKEAMKMIEDAISKFQTVLTMDPTRDEAVWRLGNAHIAKAYLTKNRDKANLEFDLAFECFRKALEMCPEHKTYIQSLRSCSKESPMYYKAIHAEEEDIAKNIDSDVKKLGPIVGVGAVGLVGWMVMAKLIR